MCIRDRCCTSANAVKVVESLNTDKVIFLPDQHLANYVAKQTQVKIISWKGSCIVHEQFSPKEIQDIREANPGIKVIGHPECPSDVLDACDFAGSTGGMIVVLQAIIFCVVFLFAPKHGFIKAYRLRKHIVRPGNNA